MRPRWTVSIDLDGVLAQNVPPENYPIAKPIQENIDKVNKLYDKGWRVVIYTGRGWYKYDITVEWLRKRGVKYHELVMGKLVAHYYIDDLNSTLDDVLQKEI